MEVLFQVFIEPSCGKLVGVKPLQLIQVGTLASQILIGLLAYLILSAGGIELDVLPHELLHGALRLGGLLVVQSSVLAQFLRQVCESILQVLGILLCHLVDGGLLLLSQHLATDGSGHLVMGCCTQVGIVSLRQHEAQILTIYTIDVGNGSLVGIVCLGQFNGGFCQLVASLLQSLGRFLCPVKSGSRFLQLLPVALEAVDGNLYHGVCIGHGLAVLARFGQCVIESLAQCVEQGDNGHDDIGLHRSVETFPCGLQSLHAEDAHPRCTRHTLDGTRSRLHSLASLFACLLCVAQCVADVAHGIACTLNAFRCLGYVTRGVGGFLQFFASLHGTLF